MRKKHNHPPRQKQPASPAAAAPALNPLLQQAIAHHQAGRLAEAEAAYRRVLATEPANPIALHLFGVVAYQIQQYPLALQLIDAALQANPFSADAHANRGIVLHALERYRDAVESYGQAIALDPNTADAYNNRGNALSSLKQHQAALDSCDHALALRPDFAEAWNNRGNALRALNRHADALASYERAIELRPDYAEAFSNRGNALQAVNLASRNFDKHDASGRDLVFYCVPMPEVWNPETARTSGVGGSEEAVIWLSRLLHRRGWNVAVYANCGLEERVYDGVPWRPYWLWNSRDRQNVTILWRGPDPADNDLNSDRIFLDLHDVMSESDLSPDRLAKIDKIFVKSKFHRSLYPGVPDEKFIVVPNGIDPQLFEHTGERDPMLLINTSSPDRSLEAFLDCFAAIKRQVPEVRAQWACGWGVWDRIYALSPEKMAWKATIQARMRELGVEELGRLSHADIAALYHRANIFAYPSEMAEIDCISLSKAMAAGAIPITTDFAAMGEKAGHGGVFLHSNKTKDTWTQPGQFHFEMTDPLQKAQFIEHAVDLLLHPPSESAREPMRQWARNAFDWNAVADAWHQELAGPTQQEAALKNYDQALALDPNLAEAHNNRGVAALSLMDYDAALASFNRAIALRPGFADAHVNRANALLILQDAVGALAGFQQALALHPEFDFLRGMALFLKHRLCDWSDDATELAHLEAVVQAGEPAAPPFATLALLDSPALQRKAAEVYTRDKFAPRAARPFPPPRADHSRIRIGYFSSDFYNHATSYLMAELFERHDRSRFEIVGLSYGPPSRDEMGKRVAAGMDRFIDVRTMIDAEAAQLGRSLELDIAVDLKGFTRDHRTGIFAERAAPIQVSYVGYPGTMGADFIDYLIADRTIIPDHLKQHYTEKVVRLPGSYQPNDSRRRVAAEPATRAAERLPTDAVVFCCFNNAYKITPAVFDLWMSILRSVEGSVLWLLEENALAAANLRAEAVRRNVSPDRLVFAQPLGLAQHLARLPLADLFLDTLPYNAHTTASDALWCGVPVLTRAGDTFAGRVAASLLHSVGLPGLITTTPREYEQLAIQLARDPARLHTLREHLTAIRGTASLFDTETYTRHLEAAYIAMYWRHTAGLAPDHLDI
jgi:predicted O-linked N-acetylglucosamine transferase (SPINDLY family)